MAVKHKPTRMCISCRGRFLKPLLTRYVKNGGTITEDLKQTMPGRGFYVCSSAECINKMHKRLARL